MNVKDSTSTTTRWTTDKGGPKGVKGDYEGATKPPINPSAQMVSSPDTTDTFSTSTAPLVNLTGTSK